MREVQSSITDRGGHAVVTPFDVTDPASVDAMMDAAAERWGRLDGLVNNAGVVTYAPVTETSLEDWDRLLRTNLTGTFLTTKAALRHLGPGGAIVNVASTFGQTPVKGYSAYCASKAAMLHFTRVVAAEQARERVRVNAIAPGYVATPLNETALQDDATRDAVLSKVPLRRIAEPEELLPLVSYLLSPASSYVTGSVFTIDGGFAL